MVRARKGEKERGRERKEERERKDERIVIQKGSDCACRVNMTVRWFRSIRAWC